MKRKRETEDSELRSAIEELSMMLLNSKAKTISAESSDDDDHAAKNALIPIKPFLFITKLLLQLLDKLGPKLAVLRQDIHQNIQRLESYCETDPLKYSNVVEIIKKETSESRARKRISNTSAFVWLTRSLDFTVKLLQLLIEDFGVNMEDVVQESYKVTLKPWHGWISSIAFTVSIKLLPDTKTFISTLMAKDEEQEHLKEEIKTFTSLLLPHLHHIHSTLKIFGVDDLKGI